MEDLGNESRKSFFSKKYPKNKGRKASLHLFSFFFRNLHWQKIKK
jgi:hypothetical protein